MQKKGLPPTVLIETGDYRADIVGLLRTLADELEQQNAFPERIAGQVRMVLKEEAKILRVEARPIGKKQVQTQQLLLGMSKPQK
jgi:predicted TIM-barrel fold metal-dependent hydrolase